MRRYGTIIVIAAAVLAGLGTFFVTLAQQGTPPAAERPPLERWLDLSDEHAEAVRGADPAFTVEAEGLSQKLVEEREKLAGLLEDPATPDSTLMSQIERVIQAHNDLERRVARHVLAIRPHLSPSQQKRLLGICAQGVRRAACRRYRWGCRDNDRTGRPGAGRSRHGQRRGDRQD